MALNTRSREKVYLIGTTVPELLGCKLPSLRMAFGLFLHHHIELHETVSYSSNATIIEIAKFWEKARIPILNPKTPASTHQSVFALLPSLALSRADNTVSSQVSIASRSIPNCSKRWWSMQRTNPTSPNSL